MEEIKSYFSLSGLSGVLIGLFSLLGVYLVNFLTSDYGQSFSGSSTLPIAFLEIAVIIIVILIIIISLFTLWIRAKRKAKRNNNALWNRVAKNQRLNVLLPIILFGAIIIVIANKGYYSLTTPLLLSFYGLLLLNVSQFNSKSLLYLGLVEILLAVVAFFVTDNEILFLIIGFGVLNILYGLLTFGKNKKATLN